MAKQFSEISSKILQFIEAQKVFFVGTAGAEGRVNVSPKGMDSLRVLSPTQVVWLNATGSGNESAAHVLENGRMTIMFMAVEGDPMILRLYGQASVIHQHDSEWMRYLKMFPNVKGARQVFVVDLDLVQTSCGFAVPLYDYAGDREILNDWAAKQGGDGIRKYWEKNNVTSMDGKLTGIFGKATETQ